MDQPIPSLLQLVPGSGILVGAAERLLPVSPLRDLRRFSLFGEISFASLINLSQPTTFESVFCRAFPPEDKIL